MLNLVHLLLSMSLAWSAEPVALTESVEAQKCVAAISIEGTDTFVCFRDDVVDAGKPTEMRGCSVRLYDVPKQQYVGYKENKEAGAKEFLLVPKACLQGGLELILKYPIDETATLENYLRLSFSKGGNLLDLAPDRKTVLTDLIQEFRAENERLAGLPRHAPPDQRLQLGSAPGSAAAPSPGQLLPPVEKKFTTIEVFFGTDRQFVPGKSVSETFGNDRADREKVTLGTVDVTIPAVHRFGNLELAPMFTYFQKPDRNKHILLEKIERLSTDQFYQKLANRVAHAGQSGKTGKKELFVFIHGYNTSFEESAQRTAQMAFDLKFPGAPVFYSWPAETLLRYAIAEQSVEWSLPHVTKFLRDIATKSGAEEIHLIAHSMGNRALTNALNLLAQKDSLKQQTFQNVILAAPDVDQRRFAQIESNVRSMTKKLTIYASENDRALQISEQIHDGPRLGQAGLVTYASSLIDTVDATAVDKSALGHSYFGDNAHVVTDIEKVVIQSLPIYRRNLTVKTNGQNFLYWQIPKPGVQRMSLGQ